MAACSLGFRPARSILTNYQRTIDDGRWQCMYTPASVQVYNIDWSAIATLIPSRSTLSLKKFNDCAS